MQFLLIQKNQRKTKPEMMYFPKSLEKIDMVMRTHMEKGLHLQIYGNLTYDLTLKTMDTDDNISHKCLFIS